MSPPPIHGPHERRVSRHDALRAIVKKRKQARALHDCALMLGATHGRERDANNVSKEAAIADDEVARMITDMTANAIVSGLPHKGD